MIPIASKKNMIIFLTITTLFIVIIFNSCHRHDTKRVDSKEKQSLQQSNVSERLLTVAMLEKNDSGQTVLVTFFETPQIFEFNLYTSQDMENYKVLKTAKEMQLPVNVRITASSDKNTIDLALPATDDQVDHYNLEKSQRQTTTPVTKPNR